MKLCTFSAAGGAPRPGRIEGDRVAELGAESLVAVLAAGGADTVREHPLADVRLCAPVPEPPSVRDFFAFEQHVATARANRGAEMPDEWYEIPVFYFSNPPAIFGPGDAVPYPDGTRELDYELEVAAVIGAGGGIRRAP